MESKAMDLEKWICKINFAKMGNPNRFIAKGAGTGILPLPGDTNLLTLVWAVLQE